VQTNAGLRLNITRGKEDTAVLWWPAPSTGWVLQQRPDIATGSWVNAPATLQQVGANYQVVISAHSGNYFYRLVHP
jgi:hypothetical protein